MAESFPPDQLRGREEYEQFLISKIDRIDQIVAAAARRYHLSINDREDFSSAVKVKLIENDFRVLTQFEGKSSWDTYLRGVVENLLRDFLASHWGKWRPSAAARRQGPLGILLERLIYRDGYSFDQALQMLRTKHGVNESPDVLHAIYVLLPSRTRRERVGPEEASGKCVDTSAEADLGRSVLVRQVELLLSAALRKLTVREQLIVRMRFRDGFTLAEISRIHRLDQKKLYREMEATLGRLRSVLEEAGISAQDVEDILKHRDWDVDFDVPADGGPS